MRKAVVFTMDAVIALAIFIASLVFFAQFFTDTTFAGIMGTNIYSQSDNFLATIESRNIHSKVYLDKFKDYPWFLNAEWSDDIGDISITETGKNAFNITYSGCYPEYCYLARGYEKVYDEDFESRLFVTHQDPDNYAYVGLAFIESITPHKAVYIYKYYDGYNQWIIQTYAQYCVDEFSYNCEIFFDRYVYVSQPVIALQIARTSGYFSTYYMLNNSDEWVLLGDASRYVGSTIFESGQSYLDVQDSNDADEHTISLLYTDSDSELFESNIASSNYPANIKAYIYENNSLNIFSSSENYDFSQKLLLRRFVIYRDMQEVYDAPEISAEVGTSNSTASFNITITNNGTGNWMGVTVHPVIENQDWEIAPGAGAIGNLPPSQSSTLTFTVTIPADAEVGTYAINASVSYQHRLPNPSPPPPFIMQSESFNLLQDLYIIKYGMLELEVGLES